MTFLKAMTHSAPSARGFDADMPAIKQCRGARTRVSTQKAKTMRLLGNAKTMMLLCIVLLTRTRNTDAFDHAELIKKFGGQLKCPYANLWLSKGPEQAAEDLGIKERKEQRRELQPSFGGGEDYGGEEVLCQIAPGAIGAGHQAGYNSGYPSDCPGTPGESSPYQWPSAWSANVDSKSVPYGNDTVIFHSQGSVYYRLDRNWKRADTTYTRGLQRSVGQGPCPAEDSVSDPGSALNACRRDSDQRRTMIHRGTQMFFITWKNGTAADDENVANIEECSWLDLAVVGNIRPDWFMDKRGDDTDVQYLGDQHVYYEGMPKLVKQWRKKDFANQYFTMSMLGNPSEDGIHWPMILNVSFCVRSVIQYQSILSLTVCFAPSFRSQVKVSVTTFSPFTPIIAL